MESDLHERPETQQVVIEVPTNLFYTMVYLDESLYANRENRLDMIVRRSPFIR